MGRILKEGEKVGLFADVKIDGSIIKETLSGVGGLFGSIREAITGESSPEKKLQALDKIAQAEQAIIMANHQVNAIEAANPNVFVSGARPYILWMCGTALGAYYVPQSLMASILWTIQCCMVMHDAESMVNVTLPAFPIIFNPAELVGLVASMLGLAGYRTAEKFKGVARS
jgi:hypothetical protein